MADTRVPTTRYDAIVVAGGRSRRLGTDKTRLPVEGVPLLDRVLSAVADAGEVVVVGEPRRVARSVVWAREDPTGGGPAAGVVAGLGYVTAPIVMLLAGDLPRLDAATVHRLLVAIGPSDAVESSGADAYSVDGAILVDRDGRRQHLTCAVVTESLRRAAGRRSTWHDAAMHDLLADLRLHPVPVQGREADDIDTPADLSATHHAGAWHEADNSVEEEGS